MEGSMGFSFHHGFYKDLNMPIISKNYIIPYMWYKGDSKNLLREVYALSIQTFVHQSVENCLLTASTNAPILLGDVLEFLGKP